MHDKDDQAPPPYEFEAGPSRPPRRAHSSPSTTTRPRTSPFPSPNSFSGWASDKEKAPPPGYTAKKRLVLWCAENGKHGRRARDFTEDLCPASVLNTTFHLDRRQITHVRHGNDGCSLTPRTIGYVLGGCVEMWSESHRTQEYHWGGETVDRARNWKLVNAVDGAHVRRDVNTVVDLGPDNRKHVSPELLGARQVLTGKPDRGLRAALTATGGVVAWHVGSAGYATAMSGSHPAGEEAYLYPLPRSDRAVDPQFKAVDKGEEDAHWARWATFEALGGRKRRARDVIRFDVGDVVVAIRANGEVCVGSQSQGDLEWWLLCVVDRPETVGVTARGHLIALYRLPTDDDEPIWGEPAAYIVNVAAGVRIHPVHHGGDGLPFAEVSVHPLPGERYQASARTGSGELHAWATESGRGTGSALSTPRTPYLSPSGSSRSPSRASPSPPLPSSPVSSGSVSRKSSLGMREVTLCAPKVTELVELPHARGTRLFPISVGVGCALCVSMDAEELPREKKEARRGLGLIGMGLLNKGKGRA